MATSTSPCAQADSISAGWDLVSRASNSTYWTSLAPAALICSMAASRLGAFGRSARMTRALAFLR
ncbi:Uncharacterised protein [Mycobacteroides abscessus subsp. abscessus]|nr:Uncharacterised protein [Mycobacteroides abscessus subsp. abscessus]